MMATKTFSASVEEFRNLTVEALELVVRASTQEVMSIAQTSKARGGRMPVDLGFLRNTSFLCAINGSVRSKGNGDAYVGVIAGMELGDTFFGGWTAEYAMRRNYGFVGTDSLGRTYNESGDFFVENAVSQWQSIVDGNARKAAVK